MCVHFNGQNSSDNYRCSHNKPTLFLFLKFFTSMCSSAFRCEVGTLTKIIRYLVAKAQRQSVLTTDRIRRPCFHFNQGCPRSKSEHRKVSKTKFRVISEIWCHNAFNFPYLNLFDNSLKTKNGVRSWQIFAGAKIGYPWCAISICASFKRNYP